MAVRLVRSKRGFEPVLPTISNFEPECGYRANANLDSRERSNQIFRFRVAGESKEENRFVKLIFRSN